MRPEELEPGDKILFNDRVTPLKVTENIDDGAIVEGPNGGEYELYTNEGSDLVAKKGKRRYSSYAENIRKVGEWRQENEDTWKHSKTGAEIRLVQNSAGFTALESDIPLEEINPPKYGYSEKQFAVEDVKKLINKHPEGK